MKVAGARVRDPGAACCATLRTCPWLSSLCTFASRVPALRPHIFALRRVDLVSKLLADHKAADAPVHDADADAAELRAEDVLAVAR